MFNLPQHFTGTYTKNILIDWSPLSNYMLEKTTWVRDTIQSATDTQSIKSPTLSDQQINDALNGPMQLFFKQHLRAYATISKVETALTISSDDLFKDSEHPIDSFFGVPESLLAKIDFSSLKELRKQCDTLTKEHYEQWQSNIQTWTNILLQDFKKNNLTLSDLEIQEFSINQPISEIEDRFIHLKLASPDLKKTGCDFQEYFTLKSTLVIQSALSRSQLPNTDRDIQNILKSPQHTLKLINKAEKELSKTQEKTLLHTLITPISVA